MARDGGMLGRLRRRALEPTTASEADPSPDASALAAGQAPPPAEEAAPSSRRPTHLGRRFDELVEAAEQRQRPAGEKAGYDRVRERLDVGHYLLQAAHLLDNPAIEPVRNLLRQGAKARVNPEINFSASAYLERHPERAQERSPYLAWLEEGRAAGEIADPAVGLERMAEVLDMTPAALADELGRRRTDLQERLRHGRLGEVWAKAAQVDPLIAEAWVETTRPKMTPLPIAPVVHQVAALHECHRAAEHRRATVVVVVGAWPQAYAQDLLGDLVERAGADEVVLLVTDEPVGDDPVVPAGVRLIDLATAARGLKGGQVDRVLVDVLRSLCARAIVGSRSELLLSTMTPYGKALHATERVFLTLEELQDGVLGPTGDALRFYYRHLEVAVGFLATSPEIGDVLARTYQTPPADREVVHAAHDAASRRAVVTVLLEEGDR